MNQPQIIFEDETILAVDKPSGMVVNESNMPASPGQSLQGWIEESCDFPLSHSREMRNGIVHRLDKETSGVILIAKTLEAFEELQRQFKNREIEKVYLGLVHGRVEPGSGTISAPIGRNPRVRTKFTVVEGGREAATEYRVISNFQFPISNENGTLVEFKPHTGRTHQIRVHAKHIGHPIVSDYLYAGRKTTRQDRKCCPRLFLHAAKLTFTHPSTGKRQTVGVQLPEDLQKVLQNLA